MPSPEIEFARAEPDEQRRALELVLHSLLPSARATLVDVLRELDPEPLGPLDALVVARREGELLGAAWAQPHTGKTAALWSPHSDGELTEEVALGLLQLTGATTDAAQITMTQALLENKYDPLVQSLLASQYEFLAELAYLSLDLDGLEILAENSRLAFQQYNQANHNAFKQLVEATYEDSLDCPDLEGRRDQEDVLAGYRATGFSGSKNWRILCLEGQDVGVLLTADHTESQSELVYMGLLPQARGLGLGKALVNEAIRLANEAGSERLMVAVDARNAPARQVYKQQGFKPWASRQVYVRWLGGDSI